MMYDGVINKPSLDEALEHYGVKGMKWKKHKGLLTPTEFAKKGLEQYKKIKQLEELSESKKNSGSSSTTRYKKKKRLTNKNYKGTGTLSSRARQLVGKVKNRNKNSYIPSFTSAMAGDSRYNRPSDGMYNDPRYKKSKKRF